MCVAMLAALSGNCLAAGMPPPATADHTPATKDLVILQMRTGPTIAGASIWRCYDVWRTDVARRDDGTVVAVDRLTPQMRKDEKGNLLPYGMTGNARGPAEDICPAQTVMGAPFPAAGWQQPDFDDGDWCRVRDIQRPTYRSTALSCLRGKFEVLDPARVSAPVLHLAFRGGAVAYLNGREIGRAGMPAGEVKPDTLATDYPREAYVGSDGKLLMQIEHPCYKVLTYAPADRATNLCANADDAARYRSRVRRLDVTVPATLLRKGTNVLAIELHRAPADMAMFTAGWPKPKDLGAGGNMQWFYQLAWNRCAFEELRLTAAGSADAVAPNVAPPKGLRIWNQRVDQPFDVYWYGDPNETVKPIRLQGLKNGVYSGQIVASSQDPVKGLRATASSLKGAGGKSVPASAITVAYARTMEDVQWDYFGAFDRLETVPEDDIKSTWWMKSQVPCVIRPIWVTVKVPKECAAGRYAGELTVTAEGQTPVVVPVELDVVGNWTLPDPQNLNTYVGLIESPETVARYYHVPLWSDAHWKLLDETFQLLGELGDKEAYIPLVGKTFMDNTDSMVRWIKQADGSYQYDYSIAEKYLDVAGKHLKGIRAVCLIVNNASHAAGKVTRYYTELDPKTGALTQQEAPAWGTPEARAFWKPVIEGLMPILAKRGLDKVTMFGIPCDYCDSAVITQCCNDLKSLFPAIKWLVRTHGQPTIKMANWWGVQIDVGHWTSMGGESLGVTWDPDEERVQKYAGVVKDYPVSWVHKVASKPRYGWKEKLYGDKIAPCFSRTKNVCEFNTGSPLSRFMIYVEGASLTPMPWPPYDVTFAGFGSDGADFWTGFRYADYGSMTVITRWYIAPGKNGPVPTTRSRMLQQSLQDMEARMFIENAIMEPALKAKLGPDLAKRVKELCDERTREFSYFSLQYRAAMRNLFGICGADSDSSARGLPEGWNDLEKRMYRLTDEVQRALDRKPN
jgi:hypothetical protein